MTAETLRGATTSPNNPFIGKSYATALNELAVRFAGREALVFEGRRWTFRDAKREIDAISARLGSLGLQRGEKISLWLPNRPEFIWYWLGAVQVGIVPVVLNNRMKLDEVAYQIDQSDSVAIVIPGDGAFRDFLGDVQTLRTDGRLPKLKHVVLLDAVAQLPAGAVDWSKPATGNLPLPEFVTDAKAAGFIVYSSGTTALPKGAVLNQTGLRKAWDHGERFGQTENDRFLMVVPLFGILANVNGILTAWSRGSCVVLEAQFEPQRIIEVIERERCTVAYLFPVMIEKIVEHPSYRPERTASLRTGILVGTDTAAMKRVADDLRMPGYFTSYGMTETSSACTRCYSDDPVEIRQTTHGLPMPDIEVEIRDIETGVKLKPRQEGEVCVRGYNVMIEYYNKPVETAAAFTKDGFFRTGDLGYMTEEGRLVFLRRIKDGYKHKGFNVSTAEVEKVISDHPDVAEAAVVGLPDKLVGDIGVAFVIAQPGKTVDPATLGAWLKPKLSSFKLPAHIFMVDEFPLTAGTGKVQKFKLRDMAIERLKA